MFKKGKDKIISFMAFISRKLPPFVKRGKILRFLYNPDKRQNDFIETIIPYDRDLKIHIDTRSYIEWCIFFWGYYEKYLDDFIKKNLPKDGVFVDVGANIGCHTLIAAKIASKVIAIEPVGRIRKRLIDNIELNKLNNVVVYPYAISNFNGISEFYEIDSSYPNQGTSSLKEIDIPHKKIKVEVKTLDEVLKNEENIDIIKIDVEGFSSEVIEGSQEIIKKFRPIIIYEEKGTDKMSILKY